MHQTVLTLELIVFFRAFYKNTKNNKYTTKKKFKKNKFIKIVI